MTIRPASQADAASIAAISIQVWVGTYLKNGVSAFFADYILQEATVAKTEALIATSSELILVSENEEGIDGFIRLSSDSLAPVTGCSDTEIATFYVQPRHHRKGIGEKLLSAVLSHCQRTDIPSVWLQTNAENDQAIAFYDKQGFEHVGETEFRIHDQGYLNNVYRKTLRRPRQLKS